VDDRYFYREKKGCQWSCHSPFFTQCYILSLKNVNLEIQDLKQYEKRHRKANAGLEEMLNESGDIRGRILEWKLFNRSNLRESLIRKVLTSVRAVIDDTSETFSQQVIETRAKKRLKTVSDFSHPLNRRFLDFVRAVEQNQKQNETSLDGNSDREELIPFRTIWQTKHFERDRDRFLEEAFSEVLLQDQNGVHACLLKPLIQNYKYIDAILCLKFNGCGEEAEGLVLIGIQVKLLKNEEKDDV